MSNLDLSPDVDRLKDNIEIIFCLATNIAANQETTGPPWHWRVWSAKGTGPGAVSHYDVMNLEDRWMPWKESSVMDERPLAGSGADDICQAPFARTSAPPRSVSASLLR